MTNSSDKNRVIIFDTTLRDGEQSPGASMNLAEKMELAQAMAQLNVDEIEAGFPIASPGDFQAVAEIVMLNLPAGSENGSVVALTSVA